MKNPFDYYLEWNPRFWEAPFLFGRERAGKGLAGKKVLEIGPRRGRMCAWFAAQGATVVGGDLYFEYLTEAFREAERDGRRVFSLVQLDGGALPFADESLDVIFTKSVFVYLKRHGALEEMRRVLKPGGYVWLVENMRYNPFALAIRGLRILLGHKWVKRVGYLTLEEVEALAPAFTAYEHAEFHLLTPLLHALPLPRRWFRGLVAAEGRGLRRCRPLARLAWLTGIVGRK